MNQIEKIVLILGGWTALIAALMTFLGNNIINRLKIQWEENSQKQLSLLKGEMDKKNSSISQILTNHSKSFFLLSEKKITSLSEFWDCIISHRKLTTYTEYLYSFLTDKELGSLLTSSDPPITKIRETYLRAIQNELPDKTLKDEEIRSEIDALRPFIGEKLYGLYYVYALFSMRSTFLLAGSLRGEKSEVWKNDNSLIRVLRDNLTDKEIDQFINQEIGSYLGLINLLEAKIISAINYSLTGEDVIDNTYKQINKIESIIANQAKKKS